MENWATSTSTLGFVVMAVVIIGPLTTLLTATLLGGPKVGNPRPIGGKVKLVFLGTMLSLIAIALLTTSIYGGIVSLIIPE